MTQKQLTKPIRFALERELTVSKTAISHFSRLAKPFEKKYKIPTNQFVIKFEQGKMGDSKEIFDWVILADFKKEWEDLSKEIKTLIK